MAVTFARVQQYLDAIAQHPGTFDVNGSPHKAFWHVTRDEFVSMNVPNVSCPSATGPQPIPVIRVNEARNSPLLMLLTVNRSVCNKRQMPGGGPFITDNGYSVTLSDGTVVGGDRIEADLADWINSGCPE